MTVGRTASAALVPLLYLEFDLLYKEDKKVFDGRDMPEGLAEQYACDIKLWIL